MKNWKKLLLALLIILILMVGIFLIFILDNYDAEEISKEYLKNTELVKVSEENEWYFFDGIGNEKVLIFYPGAKVEEIAYAKLMNEIAQNGIDCYLVKLPFRLAFFNANGADEIISKNDYKEVFVGGHSLGGVIAGNYAYENMNKVNGLILVESRAAVKLDDKLKVLTIYATNDGILNKEKYEKAKSFLPKDYKEVIIEGGNHANVADYGPQKGDMEATISKEEQQAQTVEAINKMILE